MTTVRGLLRKLGLSMVIGMCVSMILMNWNHGCEVLDEKTMLVERLLNCQECTAQRSVKLTNDSNLLLSPTTKPEAVSIENYKYLSDSSVAFKNKWVGFPDISGYDCAKAFNSKVNNSLYPQKVQRVFPGEYIEYARNCSFFRQKFGFHRYPEPSLEETEFPIAFIILFYKDLDQVLHLLRAIYRPHNVVCLTIDTKASVEFLEAVRSVSKCLPNVFVASKLESIVYAGFSRLMADIDCMQDLVKHPVQWKYAINLPGQQFPLRTNLELVRILKMFNGANDVEGIIGNRMLPNRYKWKHKYVRDRKNGEIRKNRTEDKHSDPPHGFEVVKGSAYGTFSRAFVEFVVNDQRSKDLLEWSKPVLSPDEYFWATLHHSKSVPVPGGYTGEPDKKPWLSTFASWGGTSDSCATIRIRGVCIFSPEDLPLLQKKTFLFANKFYITHHPGAMHCLDEMLYNQSMTGTARDLSFYSNLPFALPKSKTVRTVGS